jgi:methylase of polypeptide subunit release factors
MRISQQTNPVFVDLQDFYPDTESFKIPCSPNLFIPDDWSRITAVAAKKQWDQDPEFGQSIIANVGIGNGIDLAGAFRRAVRPRFFIGVDYNEEAVAVAGRLARSNDWPALIVHSDLLGSIPDLIIKDIHEIRACIPQVPCPDHVDLMKEDNTAHYYNPDECADEWNTFGLGLTARLLEQASERAPQAKVALTLAGRPGVKRLKEMFEDHGYKPSICHEEIFRQHSGTDLAPLVKLEKKGLTGFEFFSDPEGRNLITAAEANERRLSPDVQDHPYHRGLVITAPGLK